MILIEPQRGKLVLAHLNHIVSSSASLFSSVSILADIFVFTYPILLVGLFLYGYFKKQDKYQQGSIIIFMSGAIAICTNLIIQLFIRKDRPETLPGLELILAHVPTISFPSDHAAISMAIAFGTYMRTQANRGEQRLKATANHLFLRILAPSLFAFSLIMGISRIAVAIHRPTDILAGWIIGIAAGRAARILSNNQFGRRTLDQIIGFGNALLDWVFIRKH